MSKILNYAGVSRVNGVLTFRTATEDKRFLQLTKLGDTEVQFVKINPVLSKSEAAKELLMMNFENGNAEVQALLVSKINDDNPFAKPKARTIKVKVAKKDAVEDYFSQVESEQPMSAKEARKIRAQFNARVKEAYEAN